MRVEDVVAKVLDVPVADIRDDSSPETLLAWSSFRHLTLLTTVEKQFKIKLTREEMFGVGSVGQLKDILHAHGVAVEG